MSTFRETGGALEVRAGHQLIRIEPWGVDSLRVRAGVDRIDDALQWALDLPPPK